jgi:hypothetical protein
MKELHRRGEKNAVCQRESAECWEINAVIEGIKYAGMADYLPKPVSPYSMLNGDFLSISAPNLLNNSAVLAWHGKSESFGGERHYQFNKLTNHTPLDSFQLKW